VSNDSAALLVSVVGVILAVPGAWVATVQIRHDHFSGADAQPATPTVTLPVPWRQTAPPAGPAPPSQIAALRMAVRLLAAIDITIPALTLAYSILHVYFFVDDPQIDPRTPGLGTLPAAFLALGFVIVSVPVLMLVADGRRWAMKAPAACPRRHGIACYWHKSRMVDSREEPTDFLSIPDICGWGGLAHQ
jgi:hypothetical protein